MTTYLLTGGILNAKNGDSLVAADYNATIRALPPIGAIAAWHKTLAGTPSTLPVGWALCDGSTVSDADSIYNGVALPNLNGGTQRFVEGRSSSGTTGGNSTVTSGSSNDTSGGTGGSYLPNPTYNVYAGAHTHNFALDVSNMTVVWIVRIK